MHQPITQLPSQNLHGLKAPIIDAGLIARRSELRRAIQRDFGPLMGRAASDLLQHATVRESRATLLPEERESLAVAATIAAHLGGNLIVSDASKAALVADVLNVLLESRRLGTSQPVIVRATTCPDYPYDARSEQYLARGGLGSGIGLCATLQLRAIKPLLETLRAHHVPSRFELCYADTEGRDMDLLKKAGIRGEEFDARIAGSIEAAKVHLDPLGALLAPHVELRVTRMSSLLAALPTPPTMPSGDRVRGIAVFRSKFYQRFFAEALQDTVDAQQFYLRRATNDIESHLTLGQAMAAERANGARVSVLTLSTSALANFFNYYNDRHVPVIRLEQRY